ncbi:MAG: hypothetical protein V2A72_00805 [Candidatus Omnitrophota bacterium]
MNKILKIGIVIYVIIVIVYLSVWYINRTLVPYKLQDYIVSSIAQKTPYAITIEKTTFSLSKGIALKNIQITDKLNPSKPILSAAGAHFRVIPIPSLRGIKILIPSISLESPQASIERTADGLWQFLPADEMPAKANGNLSVLGITFTDASVSFVDNYKELNFRRNINGLKGRIRLSLPNSVSFAVSGIINDLKKHDEEFSASGGYHFIQKRIIANVDIKNASLANYTNAYLNLENFKISSGIFDINARFTLNDKKQLLSNVKFDFKDAKATMGTAGINGAGKVSGTFSYELGHIDTLNYNFDYDVKNLQLVAPHPIVDSFFIRESSGNLNNELWKIKNLIGNVYDGPIILSGTITSPLKDPKAKLRITSEVKLKKIKGSSAAGVKDGIAKISADIAPKGENGHLIRGTVNIKALKFEKEGRLLEGDFDIYGHMEIGAQAKSISDYKGNIVFNNAKIRISEILPLIYGAKGKVLFSTNALLIKDLTGYAGDAKITSDGKLDYSLQPPAIEINAYTEKMVLSKLLESLPESMKQRLSKIEIAGFGDLNLSIRNSKDDPDTLVYQGELKIEDAVVGMPWLKEKINGINCELIFEKDALTWNKLTCMYKNEQYISSGTVVELNSPLINAALESKDFNLKTTLKIHDDYLDIQKLDATYKKYSFFAKGYVQDFKKQPIANLLINAYDGTAEVNAKVNLESEDKPYLVSIAAKDINIEKLIPNENPNQPSKMSGNLALTATLNGYLNDRNSLKGGGWLQVSGGYLGRFPVIFAFLDAILGIPPEYLILTDAFGNFSIFDNRIHTNDFKVLSQKAALLWQGSLGFDGTLDFNVTGRFAGDIIKMTNSLGKIASAVLDEAGAYIVEAKLTGTLKEPKYSIVPFPIKKILNEKVVDKVKDIFGDIFQ